MYHKLQEGAIFIADAHYPNHKANELLELLNAINNGTIKTAQLILLGDIFDLLVGNSPYLKKQFSQEIELINTIASKIEVLYLEGNHDFYLTPLFSSKVKVIPIQKQPFIMQNSNTTYALCHGDKYTMPLKYRLYTKLIRNPLLLKLLPDSIAINKLKQMQQKKICKKIPNFNTIATKIKTNYTSDYIIEGHYHQGKIIDNYYALPSFGCSTKVAIFQNNSLGFKTL